MKNLTFYAFYVKSDMGSKGRSVFGTSSPVIETGQDSPNTGLRHRTRMGNLSQLRVLSAAHTRTETYMSKHRNRVCGADVHKDLIVATIIGRDDTQIQAKFGTTQSELERFKDWLIANNCEQVAFEATGVYWIPVNDILSTSIDTIVANPWQIKTIPNDKSDAKDANRIATLCLNGQIKRSRIFTKDDRDLRTLTRARSGYVKMRTQLRNRIHKHLSSNGIKLSSCIYDIFGKSGRHILNGLVKKANIDQIIEGIPSGKIKKKENLLREALGKGLDEINRMLVGDLLDLMENIETKIEVTGREIFNKLQPRNKDLAIVMSVPGIGFVAASVILAEIGDYRDFETPEQLAKWCGLNPGENESAGKRKSCGITKRGSKHLRTILVEIAHVIARMSNSRLSRFFQRLKARKNYNVAITALARKLICLIYHLLINQELYLDNDCQDRDQKGSEYDLVTSVLPENSLDDKVAAIVDAFYHLKASNRKGVAKGKLRASRKSGLLPRRSLDGGG
jgi:transposase